MRKVKLLLICAMVLLLSLALVAGCGGTEEPEPAQEPEQTEDPEVKPESGPEVTIDPNYPNKPITYTVTFDAGGQSDIEARRQQPILEKILGTNVIVNYKVGGGGAVGWAELVNEEPDGYYFAGINIPHIVLQPANRDDAGYKTEEIEPVAFFQATPIGLAVQTDSPFDTLDEFVEYAKEHPGAITIGGSGTNSGHDLATLQLETLADIKCTYVPFTGAAPQNQAFLGGHVAAIMGNSDSLVSYQDKMKILAIGSTERFAPLPDVPTFLELGYDMVPSIDRGVAVPPGTPEEYKKVLSDAFMEIANDEAIKRQMLEEGFVPLAMDKDQAKAYLEEVTSTYISLRESL